MTEVRKDRRAPASLKVKYKCETVDDFVEQLGGDVSRGGIFIKTKKPLDPGALLKFEFQLQNGEPVLYGVGRVAWRRAEQAARPALPSGMGIKFIKLNGDSRDVIERIEAKHGQGSRYDQTEGAELAASISSMPPSASAAPPAGPARTARSEPAAAAPDAGFGVEPSTARAGRPISSSPPLREARVSGLKASPSTSMSPSLRPPPPASSSVPPPRASAGPAPRGALGSPGPARRSVPARSAARDTSEFLATAFSVGGAGRELRSEAHAQAERARTDPHSVDLANELFGDLQERTAQPDPDATLDSDPVLGSLSLTTESGGRLSEVGTPPVLGPDDPDSPHGAPTKRPPAANDQLSLSLGGRASAVERSSRGSGGRGVWLGGLAVLCVLGGAAFYLMQAKNASTASTSEVSSAAPVDGTGTPPQATLVSWEVSSTPAGAAVSVDGQERGATPLTLELPAGQTVEVRVRSPGFAEQADSVVVANGMAPRSFALDPLPYEVVVAQPKGAKVKVGDTSVEAPKPLALGPLATDVDAVTVVVEKAGFQRATRTLPRGEFTEQDGVMRAELSVTLTPASGSRERRAARASSKTERSEPETPPVPEPASASQAEPTAAIVQVKEMAPPEPPRVPEPPVPSVVPAPEPEPEPEPELGAAAPMPSVLPPEPPPPPRP